MNDIEKSFTERIRQLYAEYNHKVVQELELLIAKINSSFQCDEEDVWERIESLELMLGPTSSENREILNKINQLARWWLSRPSPEEVCDIGR
jgi:hypothetical protein